MLNSELMIHTIQQLYSDTTLKLKALYSDEEARAITDRLFEHYFNITPVQRFKEFYPEKLMQMMKKSPYSKRH